MQQLPDYRDLLAEVRERAPVSIAPAESLQDVDDEQRQMVALENLIERAENLASGLLARDAVVPGQGWSVPRRVALARDWQQKMAPGGAYEDLWQQARLAIPRVWEDVDGDGLKEPAYPGLDLLPQVGLVPLGPDPDSGLWEFAHLLTGAVPQRDAARELILDEAMGLVFVLVPGTFNAWLAFSPGPVTGKLNPFLLSKYELTKGQWSRLTGENPSAYGPDPGAAWKVEWLDPPAPATLLHPVEQVSWFYCDTWMTRAAISLPSEAQWLRGARGGTETTKFWSGDHWWDLDGVANLRDSHFKAHPVEIWGRYMDDFHDHAAVHTAVGRYAANPFGLHEVHGNVNEWILDCYAEEGTSSSLAVDPVTPDTSDRRYLYHGGCFRTTSWEARFQSREFNPPGFSGSGLGLRPARAVQ